MNTLIHSGLRDETAFNIRRTEIISAPLTSADFCKDHTFIILWLEHGNGIYRLTGFSKNIEEKSIYCVCREGLRLIELSDDAKGYIISFAASLLYHAESSEDIFYSADFKRRFETLNGVCMKQKMSALTMLAAELVKEYNGNDAFRTELISRHLKILFTHIRSEQEQTPRNLIATNHEVVNKFLTMLEKNFKLRWCVKEYAEALFVTPNYLNVLVKRATGISAGHIIRQRIVREAKMKAVYSNFTMKESAYHLGFEDMAHFSRLFKKESGINYSEYKRISASF